MVSIAETFNIATHNGTITVHNTVTGNHRTFRIRTQKKDATFAPGERIVSLLTGSDNITSYTQFGFVKPDGSVALWRKYNTPHFQALVRVLRNPEHFIGLGCTYLYEGKCRVCNAKLTTPNSIRDGVGPVCGGRD